VNVGPNVLKNLGSVYLDDTLIQFDNVTRDPYGYVRAFTIAALDVKANKRYVLGTSADVVTMPPVQSTRVASGGIEGVELLNLKTKGNFRSGHVCREAIYTEVYANKIHVGIHETVWANGKASANFLWENDWQKPAYGADPTDPDFIANGPRARDYTARWAVGAQTGSRFVKQHYFAGRWIQRVNDPVRGWLLPLDWTGDNDEGMWKHLQDSRVLRRFIDGVDPGPPDLTPFSRLTDDAFPVQLKPDGTIDEWALGPYTVAEGAPGDSSEIGMLPAYTIQAARHMGLVGWEHARRIFDLRQGISFWTRHEDDKFYRIDEQISYVKDGKTIVVDANYTWDERWMPFWKWNGNLIGRTADSPPVRSNQWLENAHVGNISHFWHAVTGEFAALEFVIATSFWHWGTTQFCGTPGYGETGVALAPGEPPNPPYPAGSNKMRHGFMNRRPRYWDCGDTGFGGHPQERAMGYDLDDTVTLVMSLPTEDDAKLDALGLWPSALAREWCDNVINQAYRTYVDGTWDGKFADVETGAIKQVAPTTSKDRYPDGLFRRTHSQPDQRGPCASWMQGIIWKSLAHGADALAWNQKGVDFTKWLLKGIVDATLDPTFRVQWMAGTNIRTTVDGYFNTWSSTTQPVYVWSGQQMIGTDGKPMVNADGTPVLVPFNADGSQKQVRVLNAAGQPATYGDFGYGKPCMTNEEIYLATFKGVPGHPVPPGTPNQNSNADWIAYWRDACVAAVDLGVPRAKEALAYWDAYFMKWENRRFGYGMQHAIDPRVA